MMLIRSILNVLRAMAVHRPAPSVSYPSDWREQDGEAFATLAEHHRVVPLLAHHAQAGALPEFPRQLMNRFMRTLHRTRLRHVAASRALYELESAFTKAGIPHVTMKGPPLANEAYLDEGLRGCDDLDVLVNPADVPAASRVLRTHGYALHPQSLPAWLVQRYHFHTQWLHPNTHQCVELHWRPADTRVLSRDSCVTNYVRELRERPAAMAVYLAVHLAKHTFAYGLHSRRCLDPLVAMHPWSGTRWVWVLDFQGLCAGRALSRAALQDEAHRWNARAALAFVHHLTDTATPQPPAPKMEAPRFSPRAALLRRMGQDLDREEVPGEPPWWLRAHSRIGFRPVRLLDSKR